jgi:hypothetical protein
LLDLSLLGGSVSLVGDGSHSAQLTEGGG